MTEKIEAEQVERPLRVVHQNERQRQHARYRLPARARVDGHAYRVADWSVGGLALEGVPKAFATGRAHEVALSLPFDGIEVTIALHAEAVWHDAESQRAGLHFVQLEERELASLRYMIDAYLAGEILTTGDLIHVVGREPTRPARRSAPVEADPHEDRRRLFTVGGIVAALLLLTAFVLSSLYTRLFTVEAVWAAVKAPVVVLRAPQASFFEPTEVIAAGRVGRGETVALTELIGGGAAAIDSPCDCNVVRVHVLPREFVAQGEPLVTLLPEAAETYVRARVTWEDLGRVRRGDRVEMELADGSSISGVVQDLHASPSQDLSAPQRNTPVPNAESLAEVTVVPDSPIPVEQLDEPVWVRIHTGSGA
jgi:alginate biosynthesis protein Alg44